MDAALDTPHGPYRVSEKNGTITLPAELLRELGVERGDHAHWILNPGLPGTLILVPSKMLARVMPTLIEALGAAAQ